ncbi:MAG: hypothetical protein ABH847_00870 [Candidatus Omnitrophota bacterium]
MLTKLTNFIFGVPWTIKSLRKKEPNSKIIASGATKGRILKNESNVQYGFGWIISRRSALILTEEKLLCGNWVIPLSDIQKASMLKFRSTFSKGLVLKISTKNNKHYQFGLTYDPIWENQKILQFEIDTQKIKYSWLSIIVRIIVIIWLISLIIKWIT